MDLSDIKNNSNKLLQNIQKYCKSHNKLYSSSINKLIDIENILEECLLAVNSQLRDCGINVKDKSSSDFIVPLNKKQILFKYSKVIQMVSNSFTRYRCVSECASILNIWMQERFLLSKENCINFHYNMKNIPKWIYAIVICYCKHLHNHTSAEFVNYFTDWCNSLKNSDNGDKYAVPFEIHSIFVTPNPSDMTLEMIHVWDVLFDLGLNLLSNESMTEFKLNSEYMYNLVQKHREDLLDNYKSYKEDDSILIR